MADEPEKQVKSIRLTSRLSRSPTKVFPSRAQADGSLLRGAQWTGFFWRIADKLFLITNWHNVTGWDPINNKALSATSFTPDRLEFFIELASNDDEKR